jgi:nucleotide-binding universal stress UspA family protein
VTHPNDTLAPRHYFDFMENLRPKLILVASDFSDTAAHALRFASSVAERSGARLRVIYADEFMPPLDEIAVATNLADVGLPELVSTAQDQLIVHVHVNVSSFVPFETEVIVGSPVASIIREAKTSGADLLVMGTHGRTGFSRLLLGSVCESVVHAVPIPVIAVKGERTSIDKVLCVVEYSPECAHALRVAAALAPEARLVLLNSGDATSEGLVRLRRWLPVELVDRCELRLVDDGELTHLITSTSAGLIATGVTTANGLAGVLRGSSTDRIVQQSECPVLTVNASAAPKLRVVEEAYAAACACE